MSAKDIHQVARAKINLYLRVGDTRADGYHDIETVFQQVELGDSVSLRIHRWGGISARSNKRFLPTDSRNLAVKAAKAFFEETGIKNTGLYINIKKNIPVGGGMAGGSTNGAAVLVMLNNHFGRPLGDSGLARLGLSLGADVPFCIAGGTALATGVGEVLSPLPPMPACHIVACRPAVSVSTKVAYALYDSWPRPAEKPEAAQMADALALGDIRAVCAAMYNDFEGPVMDKWPELRDIKEWFLRDGALGAMMTGTGSVVFGVYEDARAAGLAEAALSARRRTQVYLTRPV